MKKTILLALFSAALTFAFVGCTPTEEASSTNGASVAAGSTETEKVACADCGHEMDKSAMKEIDGKMVCVNCAEKHDGNHDADMINCACGMQVAKADAIDVDGTLYCKMCAEKMKGDVPVTGTTPAAGDHGPDDGHGH